MDIWFDTDPGFGGIWVDDDHVVHVVMTADRLSAAETAEMHPTLSEGQRLDDVHRAARSSAGSSSNAPRPVRASWTLAPAVERSRSRPRGTRLTGRDSSPSTIPHQPRK